MWSQEDLRLNPDSNTFSMCDPRKRHLGFVYLSFHICKMGITITSTSHSCGDKKHETISVTCFANLKCYINIVITCNRTEARMKGFGMRVWSLLIWYKMLQIYSLCLLKCIILGKNESVKRKFVFCFEKEFMLLLACASGKEETILKKKSCYFRTRFTFHRA